MIECRIPDVVADAVVKGRHARPLVVPCRLVDGPKHRLVTNHALGQAVVVHVPLSVVRHDVCVEIWRDGLKALEHGRTIRISVPQLGGQREAERYVAVLETLAEARVDLQVLLVEDVVREGLLRKGAGDRLRLDDPPPH